MKSPGQVTQQLMFSLIEVWKGSGKTQREFCQEKDLAHHKFYYWSKKYNRFSSQGSEAPSFKRLAAPVAMGQGPTEVHYPDGRKLVFHGPVEPSFLRTLLS